MERMKEYIERAAICKACKSSGSECTGRDCEIPYVPAADVAEVRHGIWLPQIVLGEKAWDCSECKTLGSPHWRWCPMCGARMDKEAKIYD